MVGFLIYYAVTIILASEEEKNGNFIEGDNKSQMYMIWNRWVFYLLNTVIVVASFLKSALVRYVMETAQPLENE